MDWTRGQTIGRGSTATVSIAVANQSGEFFAVKTAELSNSEILQREQRILSTLECPQIVAYKGCNISSENGKILYNLFLEYAPGGTLSDAIGGGGGGLEVGTIRSYTRAVLLGLEYLHSIGIVHCDIKGQNILVTNDGAKIADLGCAKRVNGAWGSSSTMPINGTPIYMAPEVARGQEQGFPADVWALGCMVLEMATGRTPWEGVSDPVSALYRIGFSSDVPEIPSYMSKQAKDFLSKCLVRNPAERWSASELLDHDFVKEQNFLFTEIEKPYNLETPTSVLNQEIWNSTHETPTSVLNQEIWNSTHKSCSSSAKERIRQLSEGNSEMVNWARDETWVTVRSNSNKEPEESQGCILSSANEVSIDGGADGISATEEYDMDIPCEFVRNGITNSNSSSSRREKKLLMACKCTNYILCRNLILRNRRFCFIILLLHALSLIITFKFFVCLTLDLLQESSLFLAHIWFKFSIS